MFFAGAPLSYRTVEYNKLVVQQVCCILYFPKREWWTTGWRVMG